MRNKATKKNMDLDLRRYGKMLYTKAEESGGSGSGDGNIDYEAIYQFYRKTILEIIPELNLQHAVIPEHLEEVEPGDGNSYEDGTLGIWKTRNLHSEDEVLFCCLDGGDTGDDYIYVGSYTVGGII